MPQTFSDIITDRDTPGKITGFGTLLGDVSVSTGFINVTSNPADDDSIIMLDLPSGCKLNSLMQYNEDLGAGSFFELVIFAGEKFTDTDVAKTVYNKNQVILSTVFDDGSSSLNSTNLEIHIENRFQSAGSASGLSRHNDELWQLAGLDSNQTINLRIGYTITTNWSIFTGRELLLIETFVDK